jgi:hypothetical protein
MSHSLLYSPHYSAASGGATAGLEQGAQRSSDRSSSSTGKKLRKAAALPYRGRGGTADTRASLAAHQTASHPS